MEDRTSIGLNRTPIESYSSILHRFLYSLEIVIRDPPLHINVVGRSAIGHLVDICVPSLAPGGLTAQFN